MRFFSRMAFGVKSLLSKRKLDDQLSDEIRTHVDMATEANVAAGMSPEEARYAALREFGNVASIQEHARAERGWLWIEQLGQDVGYAGRQLARSPGFTVMVVLTLGLGIGAIAAICSVIGHVVLNPVPGPHPDRVVQIGELVQRPNEKKPSYAGVSPPVFAALEAHRDFFAEFTWHDFVSLDRKGEDFAVGTVGALVPQDFFSFFDARPLFGRGFVAGEAIPFPQPAPKRDTSIVISYAWWQTQFGSDPSVLGRVIELGDRHFTVVGVMPAYFQFPTPATQFWLPSEPLYPGPRTRRPPNLKIIARLKADTAPEQITALLETICSGLTQTYKNDAGSFYGSTWSARSNGLKMWSLPLRFALQQNWGYADLRQTLLGFLAATGFVLLIICANTANFTLARTERRRHELAIRAAMGAGQGRLLRQLLTENLLLAGLGGAAGLLVTVWGMRLLSSLSALPRLRPVEMDSMALGVALAASLLTGLFFGAVPAWRGGRVQAGDRLKQGGVASTAGRIANRYRDALVIVEVALAVVLITGAGLMFRHVERLLKADPGFEAEHLVAVTGNFLAVQFQGSVPDLITRRNALMEQVREGLAALPGVEAVGFFKDSFQPERIDLGESAAPLVVNGANSGVEEADFFRTARVPLLAGRHFTRDDIGAATQAVIINESMAQQCWPGGSALDRKFRALDREGTPVFVVVGVTGNAGLYGMGEIVRPLFFRPYQQAALTGMPDQFFVRTSLDAGAMSASIRQGLKAVNPGMRMPEISVMRQRLYDSTLGQRTYRNYLAIFAGTGLLLAVLGVYGVLAFSVARRTREIGIRLAVGADVNNIIKLVVGEGARLIAFGMVAGLVASFWLTKLLQKQIHGTEPNDPLVLAGVVLILGSTGLLACWLPARRAAKVDPVIALRAE